MVADSHLLLNQQKILFIKGIEYQLENLMEFEVSHKLYKGHLLVPHQIKDTSRKRELVDEVKKYFDRWLQRIAIILTQGKFLVEHLVAISPNLNSKISADKQIVKDSNHVGPQHELKYWERRVERYKVVSEFIASRAFVNHLACLQYTKAKLLKV